MAKYKTPPQEKTGIEAVKVGGVLRYWDRRIEGWRYAKITKVGFKLIHVIIKNVVHKIRRDDERMFILTGRGFMQVENNPS